MTEEHTNPDVAPEWLVEALDGLFAYDDGATDSGIHDERLRAKCKAYLQEMSQPAISRLIRDMWLSESAINQGYGIASAVAFVEWLDERMEIDVT